MSSGICSGGCRRTSPARSRSRSRTSGWVPKMSEPRPLDPYKVLQVDSEAEDEVIQAAYRRLARKYHPDLAETADAANRMAAINAAWELIGAPAKRQAFDRSRALLKTTPVATDAAGHGSAAGGTGPGSAA